MPVCMHYDSCLYRMWQIHYNYNYVLRVVEIYVLVEATATWAHPALFLVVVVVVKRAERNPTKAQRKEQQYQRPTKKKKQLKINRIDLIIVSKWHLLLASLSSLIILFASFFRLFYFIMSSISTRSSQLKSSRILLRWNCTVGETKTETRSLTQTTKTSHKICISRTGTNGTERRLKAEQKAK